MDQKSTSAYGEYSRIIEFVRDMNGQGKITAFEAAIIRQEAMETFRDAGQLTKYDEVPEEPVYEFYGKEDQAVTELANKKMRRKIVEFHPELEAELTREIERPIIQSGSPKLPEQPKPGGALDQYLTLLSFIDDKRRSGELARSDAYEAYAPAIQLFEEAGVEMGGLTEKTDKILLVKARKAVEEKLLEVRRDLAGDLRNLKSGRNK